MRRALFTIAALAAGAAAGPAAAHHGWNWTSGENIELTGTVESADLGNPHGVLRLDVDGAVWEVEVGQPWRNARAGIADADLAPGSEITVIGEAAANPDERRLKVERLVIDGQTYELYPDRD